VQASGWPQVKESIERVFGLVVTVGKAPDPRSRQFDQRRCLPFFDLLLPLLVEEAEVDSNDVDRALPRCLELVGYATAEARDMREPGDEQSISVLVEDLALCESRHELFSSSSDAPPVVLCVDLLPLDWWVT
jgi:hypothetical protein